MVTPDGLLPEAERIWIRIDRKTKIVSEDYHHDIDFQTYFQWWRDIAPHIPINAAVVIDNCKFHNVRSEGCPDSSSRKWELQEFLMEQGIAFDPKALKVDLWKIVQHHYKYQNPHYCIDEYLKTVRPDVSLVREPPYHVSIIY